MPSKKRATPVSLQPLDALFGTNEESINGISEIEIGSLHPFPNHPFQVRDEKYMEDLTDMQNHVLPYLQSFCSLEEKGVKERREQQVAEKNESREAVPRAALEANIAVKDAGKAERKAITEKKTITGKEKKPSIHERLEINKRIIQEKQGKDKPERGADLSVRTV